MKTPIDSTGTLNGERPRIAFIGRRSSGELSPLEFGNKAANLAQMASLGVPVPPAFVLGTSVCEDFYAEQGRLPEYVPKLLEQGIAYLEEATGLRYGDRRRPLLVSVRSGAAVSMPGLMETLLNIGLSRHTLEGLVFTTGNPRFAWDSYRRLIQSFGETVNSHEAAAYESCLSRLLKNEGIPDLSELGSRGLRGLANEYEELYADLSGARFPLNPAAQLRLAVRAVLRSARGPRVEAFVRASVLDAPPSTAVTVQAMVFGNRGLQSGAGVVFTRDPATGAPGMMVDFKFGAQGEDVVSGRATGSQTAFAQKLPEVAEELQAICAQLEKTYGDMQDVEFTVQDRELFILQSRAGKRAPLAALRIAVDMVAEGLLTPAQGLARLEQVNLATVSLTRVDSEKGPVVSGEPASTGAASGRAAFTNERAEVYAARNPVILVRDSLSPDDLPGVSVSRGVLAAHGARTSHAAVVARQLGKVCVVNCPGLSFDGTGGSCRLGTHRLKEGDVITIDGNTGAVYLGELPIIEERPVELLDAVESWRHSDSR